MTRSSRAPRARTTLARLAVNATLAGMWASGILALLVFFLNAHVPLTFRNYWPVALPLVLFYAPLSALLWTAGAGAVRAFAAFRVRVPWVGFRPFWRFLVADLLLLAFLFAFNLAEAREYLPEAMTGHLLGATVLLGLTGTLLAVDTLRRGWTRRRLRPAPALLAALLLTAGLFAIRERYQEVRPPVSASEIEPARPEASLIFLGLDGISAADVLARTAEGRLPALRRLTEEGTSAPLTSPRPVRPAAAWATALSGQFPDVHGVTGRESYALRWPSGTGPIRMPPAGVSFGLLDRVGLLRRLPAPGIHDTPLPTLQSILARCGYRTLAAGWDGMLGEEVVASPDARPPDPVRVHIEALERRLAAVGEGAHGRELMSVLRRALEHDSRTGTALLAAATGGGPQALLLRLRGLDSVLRTFTRYSQPDRFGNVTDLEIDRYGEVIPEYLNFIDAWVGALVRSAGPDVRVAMVSPFGVRPVGIGRRLRNTFTGSGFESGTHRGAGEGILLAAGPGIRAGGRLERARAVDVLPAILYLLDLPVGRDMPGHPLPGLVTEGFAGTHALAAVPSWRTVTVVEPEEEEG